MIIKNIAFEQFAEEIRQKKQRIVIFGAGVIGTVTALGILKEYKLETSVECFVDNNAAVQNTEIPVGNATVKVYPADVLTKYNEERIVILLAISRCSQVLEQLDTYENLKEATCFLLPMMCISNFRNLDANGAIKEYDLPKIPKVIHYMWLGKKEIPSHLQKCIASWEKYCPDYEIKRWDESNYDIDKNEYMSMAYREGMYGFVPDYARLDILYQNGGIYLDTDVELVRSLDDLLYQDAFTGVEKWQTLNFGGCSGSVKGGKAVEKLLEARKNVVFLYPDGRQNKNTCGYYDTLTAMEYGYHITGKCQKVLDMNIYPSDYFHPYDYMSGRLEKTSNTFSIHHFNGGWLDVSMKSENEKIKRDYERLEKLAGQTSDCASPIN